MGEWIGIPIVSEKMSQSLKGNSSASSTPIEIWKETGNQTATVIGSLTGKMKTIETLISIETEIGI